MSKQRPNENPHTAAQEESGMKEWMDSLEAKVDGEAARRRDPDTVETDDGETGPASLEDEFPAKPTK